VANDWSGYYRWMEGRSPRPLLTRALATYGVVAPTAVAVDVGCGDGTESLALLEAGFQVTSVDPEPTAMAVLDEPARSGLPLVRLRVPMQEVVLPGADLVYAGFSLPFCPPDAFDGLWARIRSALRPGGLLACDLFGDHDTWAGEPGMTFVTRDRVAGLLDGFDVVHLEESEEDGNAFSGPKHWHTFEVVARVRSTA
jgi:SAM-dependent methyltransferase